MKSNLVACKEDTSKQHCGIEEKNVTYALYMQRPTCGEGVGQHPLHKSKPQHHYYMEQ